MARKYDTGERKSNGGRLVVKPDVAAMPYANADQNGLVAGLCETKIERSNTERCVALLVWCRVRKSAHTVNRGRYKLCVESAGIAAWLQIKYLKGPPQQDSICTCGPRESLMPIPLVEAYQHHLRLYTGKTIHSTESESWCLLLCAAVWCVACASVLTHWVLLWNRRMLAPCTTSGRDHRSQLGRGGTGALSHAIRGVQLQATHCEVAGTGGRRHAARNRPRHPRCQHDHPTRGRAHARSAT